MDGVVIHGAIDRASVFELSQIVDEKLGVECVGVVIVKLRALLIAHAVMLFIIVVVIDNADVASEALHYPSCYGGFAAAGASGNSDDQYVAHFPASVFLLLATCRVFALMQKGGKTGKIGMYGLTGLAAALFFVFYPVLSGKLVDATLAGGLLKWLPTWPF